MENDIDYLGISLAFLLAGIGILATYYTGDKKSSPVFHLAIILIYLPVGFLLYVLFPNSNLYFIFILLCIFIHLQFFTLIYVKRKIEKRLTEEQLIQICKSPGEYHRLILDIEKNSTKMYRLPSRIGVIFKSEDFIREIAQRRFGHGHEDIIEYTDEHLERKRNFLNALATGHLVCKEIYNVDELKNYVLDPKHNGIGKINQKHIVSMLQQMIYTLQTYPTLYMVGLTKSHIPFKYQIFYGGERSGFVLHEAIGESNRNRLNSIAVFGTESADEFSSDFDNIWFSISPEQRNPEYVIKFLNDLINEVTNEVILNETLL